MSFSDLSDQPEVAAKLRQAVQKGHLGHALLFLGPAGSGQIEAARALAQALFCPKRDRDADACGECASCRQVAAGSHPDLWVQGLSEDSMQIKIAEVRALLGRAAMKPMSAPAKLFVIEPAEALNESAQNALLKTLEEPEGHTVIVLICHAAEKLLPTIRSRTQAYHFRPVESNAAEDPETAERRRLLLQYALGETVAPPELGKVERDELVLLFDRTAEGLRETLRMRIGAELPESIEHGPMKRRAAEKLSEETLMDRIELFGEFRERVLESANLKLALPILWDELAGV